MWKYNSLGETFDDGKYSSTSPDNTFEPMVASGLDNLAQHYNSIIVSTAAGPTNDFNISAATQNGCFTTVVPFYESFLTTSVTTAAQAVTGGFMGSNTTCLDYVIDEMSLSGTHTLDLWTQDMGSSAAGALIGVTPVTPTSRIKALITNADALIWGARSDPKDTTTALTGVLAIYN